MDVVPGADEKVPGAPASGKPCSHNGLSAENAAAPTAVPPLLPEARSQTNYAIGAVFAGLALLAAAVLFYFDPAQHGFYPRCILYRTTGFSCPGCGGLRALHHLLHGEIGAALRLNALLVVVVPVAGIFAARSWLVAALSPNHARVRLPQALIWCIFALTVLFGLLRNTPFGRSLGLAP